MGKRAESLTERVPNNKQHLTTVPNEKENRRLQAEREKKRASEDRKQAMKRRVYCAVGDCGQLILEISRKDVGQDAPVDVLGLCSRHID